MERQRRLRAGHRIGPVHMHGDTAGIDAQIANLAGSGVQVVIDGVVDIDRVRVGEPLATSCSLAACTVPLLVRLCPLEVTWAVMSASMEIPWLARTTPAATGSKCSG